MIKEILFLLKDSKRFRLNQIPRYQKSFQIIKTLNGGATFIIQDPCPYVYPPQKHRTSVDYIPSRSVKIKCNHY